MHIVFSTLDSLGTLSYVVVGLILIIGSKLVRRIGAKDASPIADSVRAGEIQIRIRSKKVVSIERNRRAAQSPALSDRRVGNYS